MYFSYMHYRVPTAHGGVNSLGGVTVAIAQDVNSLNPNEVAVSVAVCRRDDRFSKSIGRNIAAGRIQHYYDSPNSSSTDHVHFFVLNPQRQVKYQVNQLIKEIYGRELRGMIGV